MAWSCVAIVPKPIFDIFSAFVAVEVQFYQQHTAFLRCEALAPMARGSSHSHVSGEGEVGPAQPFREAGPRGKSSVPRRDVLVW